MEENIKQRKMDTAVVERSIHDKTEPHLSNTVNLVFMQLFRYEADLVFNG